MGIYYSHCNYTQCFPPTSTRCKQIPHFLSASGYMVIALLHNELRPKYFCYKGNLGPFSQCVFARVWSVTRKNKQTIFIFLWGRGKFSRISPLKEILRQFAKHFLPPFYQCEGFSANSQIKASNLIVCQTTCSQTTTLSYNHAAGHHCSNIHTYDKKNVRCLKYTFCSFPSLVHNWPIAPK